MAKLISEERVGKELCRKIRRYQKMLERAYLKKKGNIFGEKLTIKRRGR
ncbi:hypothetical protein [Caldimicrobium thiodismutans]|nr:hypothetical protein [Caldimicrobium thiodismutans]